jgi:putative pyruvate formate lyase activating enzyme
VDTGEFARICLALRDRGAENINIVTGSHAVPAIVEGIAAARAGGLEIPVLWNSSAYELPGTLDLLADTVDLYLPDLKTLDREIARRYFNAPDYPEIAAAAIVRMMDRGPVMVRHLVLPGRLAATRDVLRWFADHRAGKAGGTRERRRGKGGKTWNLSARPGAALSLMFQYTPVFPPGAGQKGEAAPDRYIGKGEYEKVLGWLDEFGIEDGFCQELVPGGADWLPDFDKLNPFPSDLSAPVWHWKTGFIPVGQGGDFLLH